MNEETLKEIDVTKIIKKDNMRFNQNEEDVSMLMDSIKHNGLLEPIGVVKQNNDFTIVWGHRRLKACQKLGHKTIKAIVSTKEMGEKEYIIKNAIENLQRKDPTIAEIAATCKRLKEEFKMNENEMSVRLGLPLTKIHSATRISHKCSKEFIEELTSKNQPFKPLDSSIVNNLLRIRLSDEKIRELLSTAHKEEWNTRDAQFITKLSRMFPDKSIKQLKEMKKDHMIRCVDITVNLQELKKYQKAHNLKVELDACGIHFKDLVLKILKGELPSSSKIFYEDKKHESR